jgi:hypothetical protein
MSHRKSSRTRKSNNRHTSSHSKRATAHYREKAGAPNSSTFNDRQDSIIIHFPEEATMPYMVSWLEIAPDYARRFEMCTDCGMRAEVDLPLPAQNGSLTKNPEGWTMSVVAKAYATPGLRAEDHRDCTASGGRGAIACPESTWRVPHSVPADHRFEIDGFLDAVIGQHLPASYVIALLRIRLATGECISVPDHVPPPSALYQGKPTSKWRDAQHARFRTIAAALRGDLEAVAIIIRAEQPVKVAGRDRIVAIISLAVAGMAYQGVVHAYDDSRAGDASATEWSTHAAPNIFVDGLFAIAIG